MRHNLSWHGPATGFLSFPFITEGGAICPPSKIPHCFVRGRDVTEILSASAEFSKYLSDPSDRLISCIECSRIYGQLGYLRKSAFFARQVAQQYQQQDTRWAAISALQVRPR